ncbi:Transglutaminase-like superfamily protein [Lachnospiraceae bacterium NE2001]|nr:Transglutaminase-like superfamily protein [Lachnospiraceae bacterium NE2001]
MKKNEDYLAEYLIILIALIVVIILLVAVIADSYQTNGDLTNSFKLVTSEDYVCAYILEGKRIPDKEVEAKEMAEVVETFKDGYINDYMTPYEKEVAIHDYLTANTIYGDATRIILMEHEAYGVLVNHKGVCEGYAKAFNLMCTCCGVESIEIDGVATSAHAWNMVKLDGEWYHVDVTWDDPTVAGNDKICSGYERHKYLNVTDDYLLSQGRTWDQTIYPACTGTKYRYEEGYAYER